MRREVKRKKRTLHFGRSCVARDHFDSAQWLRVSSLIFIKIKSEKRGNAYIHGGKEK